MTCTIPVTAAPISQMQAALFSIVMAGDEPISFQQLLLTKYMILTEIWMFAGLLLKASTDWRSNIHSTTSPNILQLWCMCIRPQVLSVLPATRVQCLPVWCLPIWWLQRKTLMDAHGERFVLLTKFKKKKKIVFCQILIVN